MNAWTVLTIMGRSSSVKLRLLKYDHGVPTEEHLIRR
jgi:hypothetical protein